MTSRVRPTGPPHATRWMLPIGLVGIVLGMLLIPVGIGAGPIIGGTICVLTWWAFRRTPWTTPVEAGAPLLSQVAVPPWQLMISSSVFLAFGVLLLLRREQLPISGPAGDVFVWIAAACGVYLGVRGLSWLSAAWLVDHGRGGRTAGYVAANFMPMMRPEK